MATKHKQLHGYLLLAIWATSIIYVIVTVVMDAAYFHRYDDYLQSRNESFHNSFQSALRKTEQFSDYVYETVINREPVLLIMKQACEADEAERKLLRGRLLSMLSDDYERVLTYDFRQLHFHLPNGDSFLRFHSPETYGDNLFEIRDTVRIANTQKRYVSGFEEGRIFNGYRFVQPLFLNGCHIGSVEVSISLSSIIHVMHENYPNRDISVILRRDIMEDVVFENEQERYRVSLVSDDYVVDGEVFQCMEENAGSLRLFENEAFVARLRELAAPGLSKKETFSLDIPFDGDRYLGQYIALRNVMDEPVGFYFSISQDIQLEAMNQSRMTGFLLGGIVLLLSWGVALLLIRNRRNVMDLALVDPLTALFNRRFFLEFTNREMMKARRTGRPISLAILDIDHFKRVNDSYGHSAGDVVLRELASRMRTTLRESDVTARYGGEEFIVLMPETAGHDALQVSERVRAAVDAVPFDTVGTVTISIGVAEMLPGETLQQAIDRADQALYRAKGSGRNRVEMSAREGSKVADGQVVGHADEKD